MGESVGELVGATGAAVGSIGADVGSTGADVGSTGAPVGATGADVGATGATVGTTGVEVGSTGADVGSTGAAVGAKEVRITTSTFAESSSLTRFPVVAPTPVTWAEMGPSGAREPGRIGPSMYVTLPGQSTAGGAVTTIGPEVPPIGAGSVRTTPNRHSSLESGTDIW